MKWMRLDELLEEQARELGDKEFVHLIDTGEKLSYRTFNDRCSRFAGGLARHGIEAGDFVALMLRNSIEYLVASYALKKLGAVEVSLNVDFRGPGLARTVNLTAAPLLITASEFLEPLSQVEEQLVHLKTLVLIDEPAIELPGRNHVPFADLLCDDTQLPERHGNDQEITAVLFTSGSTGFSKGVRVSHRYFVCNGALVAEAYGLNEDDCVYTPWPLHHYGAAACEIVSTLLTGGRVILRRRLSISRFFDEVRETHATWAMMMGGSQKWLWDRPPGPQDRDHSLRLFWGGPFPVDRPKFEQRFGLRTGYCYGLSDIGNPCIESIDVREPANSCGKVRTDLFDIRIVDEHDEEVPNGKVGELVCRPKVPGIILHDYYGQPDYTLQAFRNLWFHTGDLGRFDSEGHLFFLDRKKQVLRHSGENILPAEVEEVVNAHPLVKDCAVVGVPNEVNEHEVAVFVVLNPGEMLEPMQIQEHCRGQLAHFMVPSIVRIVDEMPMTSTEKPALGRLLAMIE